MSLDIRFKRGTAAALDAYTGAAGEIAIDTTNNRMRIFDGTTLGGHELGNLEDNLTEAEILAITNDASNLTEGTLATERLDIHELMEQANIRYHAGQQVWHVDAGTMAP